MKNEELYPLKELIEGSSEQFNVDCASCSNCNGRECGRIEVSLSMTHDEYKSVFGSKAWGVLMRVNNSPLPKADALLKELEK